MAAQQVGKRGSEKKIRDVLGVAYAHLDATRASGMSKAKDASSDLAGIAAMGHQQEFYPYVSYRLQLPSLDELR